jgi:hypothetical protein
MKSMKNSFRIYYCILNSRKIKSEIFIPDFFKEIYEHQSRENQKENEEEFIKMKQALLMNISFDSEETIYQNMLLLLLDPNLKEKNLMLKLLKSKDFDFWNSIVQYISPELKLYSILKQSYFPIITEMKSKQIQFKKQLMKNFHSKIENSLECYEKLSTMKQNKKVKSKIKQIESIIFPKEYLTDFYYLCDLYDLFEFNLKDIWEYENMFFKKDNLNHFVLKKCFHDISMGEMDQKIRFLNEKLLKIFRWFSMR